MAGKVWASSILVANPQANHSRLRQSQACCSPTPPGRVLKQVHGGGQAHCLFLLQVLGEEALQGGGCRGTGRQGGWAGQAESMVGHPAPRTNVHQHASAPSAPHSLHAQAAARDGRTVTVEAARTEESQCVTPS